MEHLLVFAHQKKVCADGIVRAGSLDMIAVVTALSIHSCSLLLRKKIATTHYLNSQKSW
jgi:hypothetical protein